MSTKRCIALLLSLLMTLTLAACSGTGTVGGEAATSQPASQPASAATTAAQITPAPPPEDNSEGTYIDGIFRYNEPVYLDALVRFETEFIDDPATQCWLYRWWAETFNIHLNVEGVPQAQASERSTLIFATNDLPDILMNWPGLGLDQQAIYGDREKQLVNFRDYYSPELTPNIWRVYEEVDGLWDLTSTLEGGIYALPAISFSLEYNINQSNQMLWYWTDQLETMGVTDPPSSTVEFLELLRRIKEEDPLGKGKSNLPLGGAQVQGGPENMLLNAFGLLGDRGQYVTMKGGGWEDGTLTSMRTDPNYYEFVKYMHVLYEEGLIDPDYYTLDHVATIARLNAGDSMFICQYDVYDMPPGTWQNWRQISPFTSPVNDKRMNRGPTVGGVSYHLYIPSVCKNPEAVLRMMDPAYSQEHAYKYYYGPQQGVDETWDYIEGWYWSEDGLQTFPEIVRGDWPHRNFYLYRISPFNYSGNIADRRLAVTPETVAKYTRDSQLGMRYVENIEKLNPYSVRSIPTVLIPADKIDSYNDIKTVLDGYGLAEIAKFITGQRPLTDAEWDAYCNDLYTMGLKDFIDIYIDSMFNKYGEKPIDTNVINWR